LVLGGSKLGKIGEMFLCFNGIRGTMLICINGIEWRPAHSCLAMAGGLVEAGGAW